MTTEPHAGLQWRDQIRLYDSAVDRFDLLNNAVMTGFKTLMEISSSWMALLTIVSKKKPEAEAEGRRLKAVTCKSFSPVNTYL